MQDELNDLIQEGIRGKRQSQSKLYALLAPTMLTICLRYASSREEAEEVLQEGFIKVFDNLKQFRFEGSFEGWVKRIMINCALQKFRSKSRLYAVLSPDDSGFDYAENETINAGLQAKDLLKLVQLLPPTYRMVFNLYVFEGMKHREIAEMLGISEGTSKSNLADARAILQKRVNSQSKIAVQKSV